MTLGWFPGANRGAKTIPGGFHRERKQLIDEGGDRILRRLGIIYTRREGSGGGGGGVVGGGFGLEASQKSLGQIYVSCWGIAEDSTERNNRIPFHIGEGKADAESAKGT